ncbi:PH domain-containing protein [Rhodoferax sp. U2-2l]|uniref:photosynthetic complex putative assembly protein PuhB n=1 Tax=Rhodoferax sp. U2-2l TaxID=2884000 RepID=UPI001D0BB5D3|nr:PH domain-containing protein [Rhodoferax sp. U2-2l]
MKATHEHEFEAAPGLPEPLPAGEKLLWQGAPDWFRLALHAFHVRKIAVYFLIMLVIQLTYLTDSDASSREITISIVKSFLTGLLAIAMLSGVAWLSCKTTMYTITDKRLVMRIGIVLTLTFNLPFKRIAAASIKNMNGAVGDIALSLYPADRIAWLHLWPHARAWRLTQPEPALRCIKDVDAVGKLLLAAWSQHHADERVTTDPTRPVDLSGQTGQGLPA